VFLRFLKRWRSYPTRVLWDDAAVTAEYLAGERMQGDVMFKEIRKFNKC